tara:strand:- start:2659 stop:2814 length:156 start_codon:yes stop_codon:yes gene_type:complete
MRLPLPDFSIYGVAEYLLFGAGIAGGFALFNPAMKQIENLIAGLKNSGSAE